MSELVVLWGIPGTGKSTFARWLQSEKGFEYVETDVLVMGRAPQIALERSWAAICQNIGADPELFLTAVTNIQRPVVVEFGMYAVHAAFQALERLSRRGGQSWWFDGDRASAKAAWRVENERSHRPFTDGDWDRVVQVVEDNWKELEDFFGSRILRTVELSGHIPPPAIYETMHEV